MQEMPTHSVEQSAGHVPTHLVEHPNRGMSAGEDDMTSGNTTHNNPGAYREPSGGPTGDATVDQALRMLDGLEGRPIHEHAAVVEGVHRALQERLADEPIDDHPADGQV